MSVAPAAISIIAPMPARGTCIPTRSQGLPSARTPLSAQGSGSRDVFPCQFKAWLCLTWFPPRGAVFLRLSEPFSALPFGKRQDKNSFSPGAATGLFALAVLCSTLLHELRADHGAGMAQAPPAILGRHCSHPEPR